MTDETTTEPDPATTAFAPPPRPRWVKVAGIVVGLLVLMFVVMNLAGVGPSAGGHGPGRHMGGATTDAGHVSSP